MWWDSSCHSCGQFSVTVFWPELSLPHSSGEWVIHSCGLCSISHFLSLPLSLSGRLVSNRLWRLKSSGPTKPVEWAYCFDVHLNAFFPLAIYIYAIQMLCWPCMLICSLSCPAQPLSLSLSLSPSLLSARHSQHT